MFTVDGCHHSCMELWVIVKWVNGIVRIYGRVKLGSDQSRLGGSKIASITFHRAQPTITKGKNVKLIENQWKRASWANYNEKMWVQGKSLHYLLYIQSIPEYNEGWKEVYSFNWFRFKKNLIHLISLLIDATSFKRI